MKDRIAILMAAGKGTRMRPITLNTPKPLVTVNGVPMIETVIDALIANKVKDIYVVVGYLGEQFSYLKHKYKNVHILKNKEFEEKNNISSIYAAKEIIKNTDCDCFICEADLVVSDPQIFNVNLQSSCYFGKFVGGYSSEWAFEMSGGRICHIGKGGIDAYNMCGISFFKNQDLKAVISQVEYEYQSPEHINLFWDEVVDKLLDVIDLGIQPVDCNQIVEIDTVEELAEIDSSYKDVLCN